MVVYIGNLIAIPGYKPPESDFYCLIDNDGNYLLDNNENYLIYIPIVDENENATTEEGA